VLAAGLARAVGDYDEAEKILAAVRGNEQAALLWQRGECDAALSAWDALAESPEVLFNRGMARLFLGKATEAKPLLAKALDAIPDTSGWNALARLYLAVAEIHG
jgi:tetratricopeptide (TPR) repeat protein